MVAPGAPRVPASQGAIRPGYTFARAGPAACAAIGVFGVAGLAWPYTVDDAFIVARYAANLVAGHGYAFNAGGRASDGVTGPLWLAPFLIASLANVDAIAIAKLVGTACMAAAASLFVATLARRAGGRVAAWSAAVVVAVSPSLGTWGAAGLETGAAALAFALAAWGALRRPAPHAVVAGLAVGALAWLRPEMAFAGGVLLACVALRASRAGRVAFALAAGAACGVIAFRLGMFGATLPLSFEAKPGPLAHGVRYALLGVLLATSGVGVALCVVAARGGRTDDRALAAALVAHALAIVLAGGDWMPGMRLWVPVLPAYAALAGVGVARLLRTRRRRLRALAPLALVAACVVPVADLAVRVPDLRDAGRARGMAGAEVARWLRAHARRVALVDVGYLAYASGVEVVDLGGLTDARIARLPGGHLAKRITQADLRARDPDVLVLHSSVAPRVSADGRLLVLAGFPVEQRVASMPWVRDEFRVAHTVAYAPGYQYVILRR